MVVKRSFANRQRGGVGIELSVSCLNKMILKNDLMEKNDVLIK